MAKKIKDYYDTDCAELLAGKILEHHGTFDKSEFVAYIAERIEGKEFSARQDIFVEAFDRHLECSYEEAIDLFSKILGPELQTTTGMFTEGWWLWPVGRYVEKHGTENYSLSLDFLYELTKRFTGEFAIRPIITAEPKNTLQLMVEWSLDPNVHVRRLASEGMRTRLPWAKKSMAAVDQFELYKTVLSNLRNDPEKFVQKSVGNNLNDLMKDDPDKATMIIDEWKSDNPGKETLWIIKHGLRSVKRLG
jgi:3-methyladenine DNA glycosylase AlkC